MTEMPEDFLLAALAALSLLGVVLLVAIWIASMRFENNYPVELRPADSEAIDGLEVLSVAGRGLTLRDLVALGLVTPTSPRAAARRKKSGAEPAPQSKE
jgi:hypothetical protein